MRTALVLHKAPLLHKSPPAMLAIRQALFAAGVFAFSEVNCLELFGGEIEINMNKYVTVTVYCQLLYVIVIARFLILN